MARDFTGFAALLAVEEAHPGALGIQLHPADAGKVEMQAEPVGRGQAQPVAEEGLEHAAVGHRHQGVVPIPGRGLFRHPGQGPGLQLGCRLAAVGRGVRRIRRPAVQHTRVLAVDVVPGPSFPVTEVQFLQTGVRRRFRADGPSQFEAAPQGAGMDGRIRRQQGQQARRGDGRGFGQGQVGATVADALGHQGPGMADQEKVHSSPR